MQFGSSGSDLPLSQVFSSLSKTTLPQPEGHAPLLNLVVFIQVQSGAAKGGYTHL